MNMSKLDRIKELVEQLNGARKAYYAQNKEIMSDFEYDKLMGELEILESETGTIMSHSPTQEVGYAAVDTLQKETHGTPMLSLDKTKDVEELRRFIGNQKVLLSWKMDGLTVVLTYRDGKLFKAVTRGDGVTGEVITHNAKVFDNIPLEISYKGELVVRGEAVIKYSDFEKINAEIPEIEAKYKNPRNLCSGAVRQLNSSVAGDRHVQFYAFTLVKADGVDFHNSRLNQMKWLYQQGFTIVETCPVEKGTLNDTMEYFSTHVSTNDFPSDGLVAVYDDIAYGDSLGTTSKFPRNAFAFKWKDEIKETTLTEIEWSPSRTGLINPVAIFEPVELEGTTVTRASLHNVSILRQLQLGIGDQIEVYKANMIIPQIADNLTRSNTVEIPSICPACGGVTEQVALDDVITLVCNNPDCSAKKIKSFSLFVSRDGLNIDGLSEATLEKFINKGFLHEFADIYKLDQHSQEIQTMEGFGKKSWEKLWSSIQISRKTTMARLVGALGIPNVGFSTSKLLAKAFNNDIDQLQKATKGQLMQIDTIGEVIACSLTKYFASEKGKTEIAHLKDYLEIESGVKKVASEPFKDLIFVVTGSVYSFTNRNALKAYIEELGGKVSGSVSKKTNYLINNDITSTSGKNKTAMELGVPIITEAEFLDMINK